MIVSAYHRVAVAAPSQAAPQPLYLTVLPPNFGTQFQGEHALTPHTSFLSTLFLPCLEKGYLRKPKGTFRKRAKKRAIKSVQPLPMPKSLPTLWEEMSETEDIPNIKDLNTYSWTY